MPAFINLAQNRFGRLVAMKRIPGSPVRWECRCDCGNVKSVDTRKLTGGRAVSCSRGTCDGRASKIATHDAEMVRRYRSGESTVKIAKSLGIVSCTVSLRLIKSGVVPAESRKSPLTEARLSLTADYRSGIPMKALVKKYGRSEPTIRTFLRKQGVRANVIQRPISPTERESLIARYNAGESMDAIGRSVGRDGATLGNLFRRHGVRMRGLRKLTIEQEKEAIRRYNARETATAIATSFGMQASAVYEIIRRHGDKVRSISETVRKHSLDEAVFDVVTEQSAYWVGFLMGDGSVARRKYTDIVSLGLAEEDAAHVEAFRRFLGSSHPISIRETKSTFANCQRVAVLSVPSDRLSESLAKFGVVPQKTYTAKVIGLENDRHFWRGLVDADGSLFIARKKKVVTMMNGNVHHYDYSLPTLSLAGSKASMEQFADFARTIVAGKATVRKHQSIWAVRFGTRDSLKMIHYLYGDCTVALPRKWAKAKEFLASWEPANG